MLRTICVMFDSTTLDRKPHRDETLSPLGAGADGARYRALGSAGRPRDLWRLRARGVTPERRRVLEVLMLLDHDALLPIEAIELEPNAPQLWIRGEIAWGRDARWPTEAGSLIEFPVSTMRAMGRNWPMGGGGYFRTGRYVKYTGGQPEHNNLLVTCANAMGLSDVTTFGDPAFCDGDLPELT